VSAWPTHDTGLWTWVIEGRVDKKYRVVSRGSPERPADRAL